MVAKRGRPVREQRTFVSVHSETWRSRLAWSRHCTLGPGYCKFFCCADKADCLENLKMSGNLTAIGELTEGQRSVGEKFSSQICMLLASCLRLYLDYFFVSDIAIFVLKRDVKLQLTN